MDGYFVAADPYSPAAVENGLLSYETGKWNSFWQRQANSFCDILKAESANSLSLLDLEYSLCVFLQ